MKFIILILNNVIPISNLLEMEKEFEFEKKFDPNKLNNSNYDLPNLVIRPDFPEKVINFCGKKFQLNEPISDFLIKNFRQQSDNDVIGLYGTTDSLTFYSDLEDIFEIHYNLKRKHKQKYKSDVLVIIDNEYSQVNNKNLIKSLLDNEADAKYVYTTNKDITQADMNNCSIEYF